MPASRPAAPAKDSRGLKRRLGRSMLCRRTLSQVIFIQGLEGLKLYLSDMTYRYEMENLCRLFFPSQGIEADLGECPPEPQGLWAQAALAGDGRLARCSAGDGQRLWEESLPVDPALGKREAERCLGVALYRALSAMTGLIPQWGILTGVRPVKLFESLSRELGGGDPARGDALAADYMAGQLLVSRDKIELCRLSAEAERRCVGKPRSPARADRHPPSSCAIGIPQSDVSAQAPADGREDAGTRQNFRLAVKESGEAAAGGAPSARAQGAQPSVDGISTSDYSLYVSIPFCPTRCAYCSFVSHSIERAGKLVPDYLDCLARELEAVAHFAGHRGLRLKTVYVGGGTPTTLSAGQLEELLDVIARWFDLGCTQEFTVEAGRPDTVTREKLLALRRGGVTRLAINPQTLDDRVLEAIGRRHTAAQALEAFALARECGFDNINMDLIAGLPLDSLAGFERTLDGVLALRPEGITVHTLSLKRSARMSSRDGGPHTGTDSPLPEAGRSDEEVALMLDLASRKLTAAGYLPYYLYRQSKMRGNLENVGWSLPGREGYYNIYMMNELHTVLAAGAGAVTRLEGPARRGHRTGL